MPKRCMRWRSALRPRPSSFAARTTLPPVRASAARMRAASSSPSSASAGDDSVTDDTSGTRRLSSVPRPISSSEDSNVTRSIRWLSSRTFPGQVYASNQARAPASSRLGASRCAAACSPRKCSASATTSAPRRRSGGTSRITTARRWYEIRPEPPARHQLAQVALRGGDQLDVEPQRGHRAETPDALLLDHLEQLALERHRQRVDLVEEEGAARGRLEEPGLGAPRIGEGPGLEAEQLGLEHGLRNRRAVDVDEGSPCPRRRWHGSRPRPAPCRSRSRPARARWARAGLPGVSKAARWRICRRSVGDRFRGADDGVRRVVSHRGPCVARAAISGRAGDLGSSEYAHSSMVSTAVSLASLLP